MEFYEITLEQRYAGQQIINRWNYTADSIPAGTSGAFKALVGMGFTPDTDIVAFGEGTVAALLQAVQLDACLFVQAIAKNLYSVTDFYTYAFPPATIGANVGAQGLSPVMAFGFTSDRTRSDIRRAQKRFVGVGENQVDSLGTIVAGTMGQLQDLGDAMGDINVVPAGVGSIQYTPMCFGRLLYVAPSGRDAYKYYDTAEEQADHVARINVFTAKDTVRSQVSRQYGRGS